MTIPTTAYAILFSIALRHRLASSHASRFSLMMRVPLLRWLGRNCYGIYVVQLPFVAMAQSPLVSSLRLPQAQNNSAAEFVALSTALAVCFSFLGGYITFHGLERHFLRLVRRPSRIT